MKNIDNAKVTAAADFLAKHGLTLGAEAIREMLTALEATAPADADTKSQPSDPEWSVSAGPMTDAQYVAVRGCKCPSCGSLEDTSGSQLTVDNGTASQPMVCGACNAEWSDMYALTGYSDLEGGINKEAIDAVVEDVERRAKEYGFSVDTEAQALECIEESEREVGEHLSEPEKKIAVERLVA